MKAEEYSERATKYFEERNFDGAIADCTELIKLEPDNPYAYYRRGMSYMNKEEFDLAIADFTEAIRLEPNKSGSFYFERALAYIFKFKEKNDLAIADFEMAVKIDPQNKDYREALEDAVRNDNSSGNSSGITERTRELIIMAIGFVVFGTIFGIASRVWFIGLIGAFWGLGIGVFWEDLKEALIISFKVLFETIKESLSEDIAAEGFLKGGFLGIFVYTPLRFLLAAVMFIFWPGLKLYFKFAISPFIAIYRLVTDK